MRICELCGSAVLKMRKHAIWHGDRGERLQPRERRSTGYCSDCGSKINFVEGEWAHGADTPQSCQWARGTPRHDWRYCNRCGHKFESPEDNELHRC